MEKLLIVDGNNLLFQMFYGMPSPIYNKKGKPIHGTIGFVSFVIKEIMLLEATEALVVFDGDSSEERENLLPQYKKNRTDDWENMKEEDVPFSQEDDIKAALDYMGVKYIYSTGCEADDTIAHVARTNERMGKRVVISSFDSDFFQCISENVSVLRYRGKGSVMWDYEKFRSEFGFSPSFYPYYKALLGDSSDNIPGIPGFGKKRAGIMAAYMENGGEEAPLSDKFLSVLEENKERVERNLKLIEFVDRSYSEDFPSLSFYMDKVREGNSAVLVKAGIFG